MNLLTLMSNPYEVYIIYNSTDKSYHLSLECQRISDNDCYKRLTKHEIETLRDNAMRLYTALNKE